MDDTITALTDLTASVDHHVQRIDAFAEVVDGGHFEQVTPNQIKVRDLTLSCPDPQNEIMFGDFILQQEKYGG